MNNIVDFIPNLILASGIGGMIVMAALMLLESVTERTSGRSLRKPRLPAPAPRPALLKRNATPAVAANSDIQAAA